MVVVTAGPTNHYTLKFSHVWIEWTLYADLPPMPVAINWGKLGTDCDLITLSDITFRRGRFSFTVRRGYEYDGASIPKLIRWAPGYQRVGRHLWAATLHDWLIDHPEEDIPRVIADALFVTLLLDTGVDRRQSKWMYRAVRLWSMFRSWQAGEEGQTIAKTTAEAAKAPETKAVAVAEAAEVAKAETSVPPCIEKCDEDVKP
jgi:hypothetical protein